MARQIKIQFSKFYGLYPKEYIFMLTPKAKKLFMDDLEPGRYGVMNNPADKKKKTNEFVVLEIGDFDNKVHKPLDIIKMREKGYKPRIYTKEECDKYNEYLKLKSSHKKKKFNKNNSYNQSHKSFNKNRQNKANNKNKRNNYKKPFNKYNNTDDGIKVAHDFTQDF